MSARASGEVREEGSAGTAEPPQRPSGRRRGHSGTRAAILTAAREQFAATGYSATSLRTIAAAAGVDVALIRYFYGSKDDLFAAAVDLPPDLPQRVATVLAGPVEGLGERMVRTYLGLWEDPATAAPLLTMFRSAVTTEQAADLLRDFLSARVLRQVAPGLGTDRPELRALLASSHLLGTVVARFVLHVEPLASLERDEVVALLAPTVQHYLTGDLARAR
ncbi:TetR/AcrR family transcriptional regulator [Quadrisphaera sp. DSM 44207]|uniref:TetR/AcrR family transcriptional regulator n=1 Tax=Quadrisphaera sp. DSM 44207 TaxID=1881057 RepID=UPI000884609D|nr:TetR family transcriptional regulator [Quadrisphaera sp. DSM 44207]SDQ21312.1 transcriptional regulator, TetR family [Quadrisphaera sp. DSM 44207]